MNSSRLARIARLIVWVASLVWLGVAAFVRPPPVVALVGLAGVWIGMRWASPRRPWIAACALAVSTSMVVLRPHVDDAGLGRLFADQTYHHQALRALNHAAAHGADVSEVLETIRHVRAGDAQGWYAAWTALGERNAARARATHDPVSRGEALLRAHTYFLRSEFFLPPDDPKRPASFDRNRKAFYDGLDTLGVAYERITVPFGAHHLNAVFYPAPVLAHAPLIVFCGGSDTTVEELYFYLVAAARTRGYAVLTFEGPGQGAVLREQGLPMTPDWEKPTSAVLDAYLAAHPRPAKIVLIGLSLGGYLAARAAAFEERVDGVVSYDVFYDGAAVARRSVPAIAYTLRSAGLEWLVDDLASIKARFDPAAASGMVVAGWMLGTSRPLEMADALSTFTLAPVADRIHQDVLVFAGTEDQFIPVGQVGQYTKALTHARSVTAKVYDRASGGAEHSQMGASTLWQADFFDWVEERFER